MLYKTRLKKFYKDKQPSLLGALMCYKEKEVLSIMPQGPYSQHYIFFVSYELAQ
jgi:hypothetical protein